MKIAFAGKGGVGKTTLCAWFGDYLARRGREVWLIDADTSLSLGTASGLQPEQLPLALNKSEQLIREQIGEGLLSLNPDLSGLPEQIAVDLPIVGPSWTFGGSKRLLLMGGISEADGGCACGANSLLKAFLAHMFFEHDQGDVLVDMEAGVEHLGRGTVAAADGLVVVSEPSLRSLRVAAEVARMAESLGLRRQALIINRYPKPGQFGRVDPASSPSMERSELATLPKTRFRLPVQEDLRAREWDEASVLSPMPNPLVDRLCADLEAFFRSAQ